MSKYDKMLEENKKRNDEKIGIAKTAIRGMLAEQERITVPKLMKKTGLSRGFFYKNPSIRKEMDAAIEKQAGIIDPRRSILDQAMDERISLLMQQVSRLKKENEDLQKENQKLKKALNKKELNLIKNL